MDVNMSDSLMFANIPISALNVSCRRRLAMALNPDMPQLSTDDYSRNWQGLLELMGFQYETMRLLEQRDDPTSALLDIWEYEDAQATVAKLLEFLKIIERLDIIDDILPLVKRDSRTYLNMIEARKKQLEAINPIQDSAVSSAHTTSRCPITVDDVNTCSGIPLEENAKMDYEYDAYVSYIDSDVQFVVTLIEKLEKEFHLRLFVKERDMLPGVAENAADLKMIHERCERILLIISPEFLSNPRCEFQTMFAQALAVDNNLYARKVIPVICKPCLLPVRLKYIARVDYTKIDYFDSFWKRLYSSIKNPPQGEIPVTSMSRFSRYRSGASCSSVIEVDTFPQGYSHSAEVIKPASLMVSTLMQNMASQLSTSHESVNQPTRDDNIIEMGVMSNSQLNVTTGSSKQTKKSPTPRTKLLKSSLFSRGTTSKHNQE